MTIEPMKTTSFQKAAFEDWERKAAASLKGKPLESLYTNTYEQIVLKPLYTEKDLEENRDGSLPGEVDYRRGIHPLGYQSETWKIANRLSYHTIEDLEHKVTTALSKGQTAIAFDVGPGLFADSKKLLSFLGKLDGRIPYSLNAGFLQAPMLAAVAGSSADSSNMVHGFIAADPVADASLSGGLPKEEEAFFEEWSLLLKEADELMPKLKTVLVNTSPYHNSGANAVQELAAAISTGVYLLQKLLEEGWELKKALPKFVFHFSVGSSFFMETAKLRAARLLWSKTAEAFGADEKEREMVISAETSAFTKTVFDPYVNMLRVGNEAFSAVLGGIQYLHTGSYAEALGQIDPIGERIARNTQLILKSEAHLEKVADPAGGSWYIESLTNQLAEKAWELFLEIDRRGGMYEALKAGWFQESVSDVSHNRKNDTYKRAKSMIGTNVYVNLADHIEEPPVREEQQMFSAGQLSDFMKNMVGGGNVAESFIKLEPVNMFAPLKQARLSEPYEHLRFRARRYEEKTGFKPEVGLICLGETKSYKTRADFISGLLAAGGISAVRSEGVKEASTAETFILSQEGKQFVICGSAEDYTNIGLKIAGTILKQHPGLQLFVAGLPAADEIKEWKEIGIQDFIHLKSDAYEVLSSLLKEMEVKIDAKA